MSTAAKFATKVQARSGVVHFGTAFGRGYIDPICSRRGGKAQGGNVVAADVEVTCKSCLRSLAAANA